MQAVILAAGMGRRLKDLTTHQAKCMIPVNGIPLIQRMLTQLDHYHLNKIIIVTGHQAPKLTSFIHSCNIRTPITYIHNPVFASTNNIYSLYLAKEHLMDDDTILLESDLIFEQQLLTQIIHNPFPNLAMVAPFESWMDGTVVRLDSNDTITSFLTKEDFCFHDIKHYYKTVNIYKFSKSFSATHYVPFLEAYSKALGNNQYYEQVLKVISLLEHHNLKALRLEQGFWYEIDDEQDLDIAETIFTDPKNRLSCINRRYGGYWRFPSLMDFCYLVNPFFPNTRMMDEMKASFETLVTSYPSGIQVNNLLAAKCLGLKSNQIITGNGAGELISVLMSLIDGTVGIIRPSFQEYENRGHDILTFDVTSPDFSYTEKDIIDYFDNTSISALVFINPDNPSGNYIGYDGIISLLNFCERKGILFIVDESFLDFAEDNGPKTLMQQEILCSYPHLAVIKSGSKSYGIPGFRIGFLASGNRELLERVQLKLPIWNINSFGEYFLQIFEKYHQDYMKSLQTFYITRRNFLTLLRSIPHLRPFESQANYIMCEILGSWSATSITAHLLNKYQILIKDLSQKPGICGRQMIRIAVKRPEENQQLAEALQNILK